MNKSSFILRCLSLYPRRFQFQPIFQLSQSAVRSTKIGIESNQFIAGLYRNRTIFKTFFQPRTNRSISLISLLLKGSSKCLLPFPLMVAVLPAKCESCDKVTKTCSVKEECPPRSSSVPECPNPPPQLECPPKPCPPPPPPPPPPCPPSPPPCSCPPKPCPPEPCPPPPPPPCPHKPIKCPTPVDTSCSSFTQLKWESTELSHEYLMKQACIVAVDAVTRILTETVSALEDYHYQYQEQLNAMIDMYNEVRNAACETTQELAHCRMIVTRSELDDIRRTIIELECYLNSVETLALTTAEVAYLGRAEYASVALSERLRSSLLEAKTIKARTTELERDMNELQALIIVESGKSLK